MDSNNILTGAKDTILEKVKKIELAFHKRDEFFNTDMSVLKQKIQEKELIVNSIHGPALQLRKMDEFMKGLEICADLCHEYNCRYIVIHPSTVNKRQKAIDFIKERVTPFLEDNDILIAWENFPGKRRIVNSVGEIAHFVQFELENTEHHGICFDTSHTFKKTDDVLSMMLKYKELIRIYHLGNWIEQAQHMPLFDIGNIDFNVILKPENFYHDAAITMEYYYTIDERVIEDFPMVEQKLLNNK